MQASINYILSRYSGLEADSEIWTYHLSKHDIFYIYIFPSPADTQIIEKKIKTKQTGVIFQSRIISIAWLYP